MGEFKLGRMTLKSLFSKPATKLYPIEAPSYFPETKGHVVVDIDRCRFDGSCANLCPTGALEVDRKALTWAIDRFKCIQCRNCVHICAEDALVMANEYAEPSTKHVVEVFEISPAERVNREKIAAEKAARAARLREEAAAKKAAQAAAAADDAAQAPAAEETPEERAARIQRLKEENLAKRRAAKEAAAKGAAEQAE